MRIWQSSDSTNQMIKHEKRVFIDLLACLKSLSLKHLRKHSCILLAFSFLVSLSKKLNWKPESIRDTQKYLEQVAVNFLFLR